MILDEPAFWVNEMLKSEIEQENIRNKSEIIVKLPS
jgi:hypothetical protein